MLQPAYCMVYTVFMGDYTHTFFHRMCVCNTVGTHKCSFSCNLGKNITGSSLTFRHEFLDTLLELLVFIHAFRVQRFSLNF